VQNVHITQYKMHCFVYQGKSPGWAIKSWLLA